MILLEAEPLTRAAFAPFGEVVEYAGAVHFAINQGFAERFNDLARIDTRQQGGETNLSLCNSEPRPLPIAIELMERHPLGSQLFFPLQDRDWLVVVGGSGPKPENMRAFLAGGCQGVNYARGVWHHPLLVLDSASRFLIVDRKGPGENLEETALGKDARIVEVRP